MPNELKKGKNSTIEEIPLKSWEEFENEIEKEYLTLAKLRKSRPGYISPLLFRGHANKSWGLETTLERYYTDNKVTKRENSWKDYWKILRAIKPAIYSLSEYKPEFKDFSIGSITRVPPCYEFMIYIRHHGFPSPLLDWTRSPYVAAYFAFNDATKEDVAIYSYLEYKAGAKVRSSKEPQIVGLGPYAEAHKRHYQQQCEYTICFTETEDEDNDKIYTNHEMIEFGAGQDFLKKYIIPSKDRKRILEKLRLMNINAFSLFGNEESLMSMLADLEIEKER